MPQLQSYERDAMKSWMQRLLRYSTLAGVAFVPIAAQAPVNESNIAIIVFFVAVGLTLLLAGGLALLMWVISLRSPHAAVGPASKEMPKREELPEGVHLPSPSIQPLILAIGMTIMVFGIVFRGFAISLGEGFSIPIIMVLGLIVTLAGLTGWIREGRKAAQSR
jgi:hypothetical protein